MGWSICRRFCNRRPGHRHDDFTGGAWYVLNGTPNGLPDENNRVLIMQITTEGEVSGVINTQVFGNGNGNADIRNTYSFSGTGTFSADGAGNWKQFQRLRLHRCGSIQLRPSRSMTTEVASKQ